MPSEYSSDLSPVISLSLFSGTFTASIMQRQLEVKGKRKRGRPRKTWRSQVEKESKSVGLKKEDAKNRARWRVGVGEIAGRVG